MTTKLTNRAAVQASEAKDFWLQYSLLDHPGTFADALHALYYLPENYKLVVLTDDAMSEQEKLSTHEDLMDRIKFETKTGLSDKTSPFFLADVVIYDNDKPGASDSKSPMIIVTEKTTDKPLSSSWNGFTVPAGNPEALASAVLNIARLAA